MTIRKKITFLNNEEIIQDYERYLRLQSKKPDTIRSKLWALFHFFEFVNFKSAGDVTKADIETYYLDLKAKAEVEDETSTPELKASSVNLYITSLKLFFKWLKPDNDYFSSVSLIPIEQDTVEKEYITADDIKKMLACCNDNQKERALLMLLYNTGARLSEIQGINIGDVDIENATIIVRGKTGKRRIPLTVCMPDLRLWLNLRTADKDAPLFTGRYDNKRISTRGIQYIIEDLAKRAGIKNGDKKVNVHAFRHRRLTELAAKNMPEMHMRTYAGWKKRSLMTAVYIHPTEDEIKEMVLTADGFEIEPQVKVIKPEMQPIRCYKCGELNAFDAKNCSACYTILDETLAMEKQEAEQKKIEEQVAQQVAQQVEGMKVELKSDMEALLEKFKNIGLLSQSDTN